jgi:hypothetical protein
MVINHLINVDRLTSQKKIIQYKKLFRDYTLSMMQMNFDFWRKISVRGIRIQKELNWNLGCPYPWIKCGMGSGLINSTEKSTVT